MEDLEQLKEIAKRVRSKSCIHNGTHGLTFVVTGASSGIGLQATKLLALLNPLHRIVVVGRTQEAAEATKARIVPLLPQTSPTTNPAKDGIDYTQHIIPLACDHTSLNGVYDFDHTLRQRLRETYHPNKWKSNGIDVLCLNAAVLMAKDTAAQFTHDGIEVTFQTNYLSSFLIVNLTADLLNPGGRVVLSTSGLHQFTDLDISGMSSGIPSSGGMVESVDTEKDADPTRGDSTVTTPTATPIQARKGFEMIDGTDFHFKRSYAASKVCMVALCAELTERLSDDRDITVNCFSPGLMTASGLFRNQQQRGKRAGCNDNNHNNNQEMFHSKEVLAKEKTVCWGAGALGFMATGHLTGQRGGQYWRDADSVMGWHSVYGEHFCPVCIMDQIDSTTRQNLWTVSCQLSGLSRSRI